MVTATRKCLLDIQPAIWFVVRSRASMPNTPVVLTVPPVCLTCGTAGTVKLQQTIRGEHVVLEWACSACQAEWPVRRKEEVRPAS